MTILSTINLFVSALGRMTLFPVRELGKMTVFFFWGVVHIFSLPLQVYKIVEQVFFIGMKSVFVICLTGAFTGMVLGLQGYYTLVKFGSEGVLGAAVAPVAGSGNGPGADRNHGHWQGRLRNGRGNRHHADIRADRCA